MDFRVSRRSFAVLAGSGVILAGSGLLRSASATTLYGDGRSDDTYALQRLIDGFPISVATPGIVACSEGGVVRLLNGNFRVSAPLRISSNTHLHVANCKFHSGRRAVQPYPPKIITK